MWMLEGLAMSRGGGDKKAERLPYNPAVLQQMQASQEARAT